MAKRKRGPIKEAEPKVISALPECLRGLPLQSNDFLRMAQEHELAAHNTEDEGLRVFAMDCAASFRGLIPLIPKPKKEVA